MDKFPIFDPNVHETVYLAYCIPSHFLCKRNCLGTFGPNKICYSRSVASFVVKFVIFGFCELLLISLISLKAQVFLLFKLRLLHIYP